MTIWRARWSGPEAAGGRALIIVGVGWIDLAVPRRATAHLHVFAHAGLSRGTMDASPGTVCRGTGVPELRRAASEGP